MRSLLFSAAFLAVAVAASTLGAQALGADNRDVPVRNAVLGDGAAGSVMLVDHSWKYQWHNGRYWGHHPSYGWSYWSGNSWYPYQRSYGRQYSYRPYSNQRYYNYDRSYGGRNYGHNHYGHGDYGHGHGGHGHDGDHGHGGGSVHGNIGGFHFSF